MSLRACVLSVMFLAGPVLAETPRVAADIAAVHSLVAKVMEGAGMPALIMPPDASPHHYSLRPSEAASLEGADVVIAVGTGLSPSFDRAAEALSAGARIVTLLDTEGTTLLPAREGVAFGDAGHDGHEDGHGHDDHGHDDAHGHDHDHGHGHDKDHDHGHEEDHAHDDHAGHDHAIDGADPHAW
ncbi:MAG: zinc ABC transporter substrate-binding protein, partial [Rhodobacteraceae bacterium]|nr:zinc ABC transporter substrate-binding protein [Paracoccaceae bacterium]